MDGEKRIMGFMKDDKGMERIKQEMRLGKAKCFSEDSQGVLWFGKRLVVPNDAKLKELLLHEAHDSFHTLVILLGHLDLVL